MNDSTPSSTERAPGSSAGPAPATPTTASTPAPASAGDEGRRRAPSDPLVRLRDLSGNMGLTRLVEDGVVVPLDDTCGYMRDQAETLFGRASILEPMMPYGTVAAGPLALWVWIGGRFPDRFDLISNSHYRTLVHGRHITVLNRVVGPEHRRRLGRLDVTSPLRTACDVACLPPEDKEVLNAGRLIALLMLKYELTPEQCLNTLWQNPRWPRHSNGVRTLMSLARAWRDKDGDVCDR